MIDFLFYKNAEDGVMACRRVCESCFSGSVTSRDTIKGDISKVSLVNIFVKMQGHASCFLSSHLHPLSVAGGEDEVVGHKAGKLDLPLYWSTILWNMAKNYTI